MGMSGGSLQSEEHPLTEAEESEDRSVCACVEREPGRETAIIGDTHNSAESIGDRKRHTWLADGAIKKTFLRKQRQLALRFACRAVNTHLLT